MMKPTHMTAAAMLSLGAIALCQAPASAQAVTPETQFAPPVRIMAGAEFLGENRSYPSPAFHDVNADGHLDAIIADLPGRVTVALRDPSKPASFMKEKPLLGKNKEQLDFGNW